MYQGMATYCMSKSFVDNDFLDSHLHQLRTTLSVIEIANHTIKNSTGASVSTNMISSSLKLIESSYEDLMFVENIEYILRQEKENINIEDFLKERVDNFVPSFEAYELVFNFDHSDADIYKLLNENLFCRIIDNAIVFAIKNAKNGNIVDVYLDNKKVVFEFVANNAEPKLKNSMIKILEIGKNNLELQYTLEYFGSKAKLELAF